MRDIFGPTSLSRRTLAKTAGGVAATGIVASRAGSAFAQATPEAPDSAATALTVENAIAQLEPLITDALAATGVPGLSVGIVFQDELVYAKGFGVRSIDASDPVDPETVFQLASVSKSLASTAVSAVVSSGEITWDDRVVKHLGDFEMIDPWVTREVTLRDCFSHRTGMYGTAGDDLESIGFSRDEIIQRMRYLDLTGQFRQTYSYSNFGLTLGGEAAANAVGLTWEDLCDQRLYGPLGMASSSSRYADFVAQQNRAELHIQSNGAWVQMLERHPDPQSPAGGASSNIIDMGQWVRMVLGDGSIDGIELIAPDVLLDTHTPQIVSNIDPATGRANFYGLGWVVTYDATGRIYVSHAGAFSVGARTLIHLLPEEQLGIVVLCNAFPTGVPEAIAYSFYDLVHQGTVSRDWLAFWNETFNGLVSAYPALIAAYATPPADAEPALPLAAYAGTYANDYFGPLQIIAEGNALTMAVGPTPMSYALDHWDRDVFVFDAIPGVPGVKSTVSFLIDEASNASTVTVQAFDSYGQGTFTRVADVG
jgi:CubicO group peptidase (beta-lactamase class C family)